MTAVSSSAPAWQRSASERELVAEGNRCASHHRHETVPPVPPGSRLSDIPYPHAVQNDVIVRVHAAGFTTGELDWPGTWIDRSGRDRTPSVPGHELSGVVAELGYGTTGLTVGQRVFGLTDWFRDGSLAEYTAVEARNLAPLPADVDHVTAAALPISGLTAWQALIDHARLFDRPDRPDPRRRWRSRFDRRAARPRGGGRGDRNWPAATATPRSVWERDAFLDLRGRQAGGRRRGRCGLRRHRRRDSRPFRCTGARRRHARHHHQGAHGRSPSPRARNLLRRRAGSVPTSGTRPTPKGRTTKADRGGAYGRSPKRPSVRPRTPHYPARRSSASSKADNRKIRHRQYGTDPLSAMQRSAVAQDSGPESLPGFAARRSGSTPAHCGADEAVNARLCRESALLPGAWVTVSGQLKCGGRAGRTTSAGTGCLPCCRPCWQPEGSAA